MNFPTDSIYKFLLIAGLFLFIYTITFLDTNEKQFRQDFISVSKEYNKYIKSSDSIITNNELDIKEISSQIAYLDSMKYKFPLDSVLLELKFLNERSKKAMRDNANFNLEIKHGRADFDLAVKLAKENINEAENKAALITFYRIMGILLILIGYFFWSRVQYYNDQILKAQFLEKNKGEIECQSCGIKLKFDSNYLKDSIYCSHCHNGTNFNIPNQTLQQMKETIKKQMKRQGISWYNIENHLSKLKHLDRWKDTLRW